MSIECKTKKSYNHLNRCGKNIGQNAKFFHEKTLNKFHIEGIYLTYQSICDKPTSNIIFICERLKNAPLRSGTRHWCPPLPLPFNLIPKFYPEQLGKKTKKKVFRPERKK